jgi:hypothetical protein
MLIGSKIGKNFAWELDMLCRLRDFSDGIDWFHFTIESDWYEGDHKPSFNMMLVIMNFKIFEFGIYNIHHLENESTGN